MPGVAVDESFFIDRLIKSHILIENILVIIATSDRLQKDRLPFTVMHGIGPITLHLVEQVEDLHDAWLIDIRLCFLHEVDRQWLHTTVIHNSALEGKATACGNAFDIDSAQFGLTSRVPCKEAG